MSGRRPVEGSEDEVSEFGARREGRAQSEKTREEVSIPAKEQGVDDRWSSWSQLFGQVSSTSSTSATEISFERRWVKFHRGVVDRPFGAGLCEGRPVTLSALRPFRKPGPARDQGQIRTFVYYELLLINDTGIAVANICRACKEDAVSQCTVRRWFNRFESGDTSLENREPSERPSTVDDDEFRRCIKEKPEVNIRELTTTLGRTKFTIHNRLNSPGYHKVLPCWIPAV
ncbi:unnamed protein product [Caenorhabditis auriculariae]|uniref:Mos1 transposase HTH domain-containing protein n=1 Tax=Caenorhabditis auriculariae TaxID=2777116 RepID=A0A8S1HRR1_9PELO|nr:unnamed protein product [Caenorhabditis auriculariae]